MVSMRSPGKKIVSMMICQSKSLQYLVRTFWSLDARALIPRGRVLSALSALSALLVLGNATARALSFAPRHPETRLYGEESRFARDGDGISNTNM
jgi:hypothetical protein